jgi:hypothetical protein
MTTADSALHLRTLRADLTDVERELDRIDALGDAAAVVRVQASLAPRIAHLRRAVANAERLWSVSVSPS